jgi:hypothetical protein
MRKNQVPGHRTVKVRGALLAAIFAGMIAGATPAAGSVADSGGGGAAEGSVAASTGVSCSTIPAQVRHLGDGPCR